MITCLTDFPNSVKKKVINAHTRLAMSPNAKTKPYHHGDLRNALLKAGMQILKNAGQDAVTTRACAKLVGCAPSAVFRHFKDRRALATALAVEGYQRFEQDIAKATDDSPDSEHMRAIGEAYIDFAFRNPHLFRLMFQGDLIDLNDPDLLSASEPLLERTGQASRVGSEASEDIAILSWAIVHGLASLAIDSQLDRQLSADPKEKRMQLMRIMGRSAPLFSVSQF